MHVCSGGPPARHDGHVQEWLIGKLLVATPLLEHPTFRRTVILLLDHNEDGALGVVVNRPSDVPVEAVLPLWGGYVTRPDSLYTGGPVSPESALCLAHLPGDSREPEGVRRIFGALAIVDLDGAPAGLKGAVSGLRVFAGYSGWAGGQLEGEIAEGSWFVVDSEAGDAFTDHPDDLWVRVLRRQSGRLAFVAAYPDDPAEN